jgi:hypothetical protein
VVAGAEAWKLKTPTARMTRGKGAEVEVEAVEVAGIKHCVVVDAV